MKQSFDLAEEVLSTSATDRCMQSDHVSAAQASCR